jgi:hypothetical protein
MERIAFGAPSLSAERDGVVLPFVLSRHGTRTGLSGPDGPDETVRHRRVSLASTKAALTGREVVD